MVLPLRDKVLRDSHCIIVDGNGTLEPGRSEFKFTLRHKGQLDGLEKVTLICLTILGLGPKLERMLHTHNWGKSTNAVDKYSYHILRNVLFMWSSE